VQAARWIMTGVALVLWALWVFVSASFNAPFFAALAALIFISARLQARERRARG
jgi:uncharacterized membrane protein YgaE (UPF0421/DUF939 family)